MCIGHIKIPHHFYIRDFSTHRFGDLKGVMESIPYRYQEMTLKEITQASKIAQWVKGT